MSHQIFPNPAGAGSGIDTDTLAQDLDVTITDPREDHDVISWNASLGFWSNQQPMLAHDADVAVGSPSDGDVLSYNASLNLWVSKALAADVDSLATLSDVLLTSLATSNFLQYDGTHWVNHALAFTDLSGSATAAQLPTFTGPGFPGIVPDPGSSSGFFLKDDGTWAAGGAGSALLIKISGSSTGVTSIMNLVPGTNIGITNPGAGANIQIAFTGTLAATLANASHKWLNSYDASTGLFTQTQPAAADLSDGTTGSGVVVLATAPTFAGLTDSLTTASGANGLTVNYTLNNSTSLSGAIPDAVVVNYTDNSTSDVLSRQLMRLSYTRGSSATGITDAFDSILDLNSNILSSSAAELDGIRLEGPVVASGKTLATWRGLSITAPSGAGTVTDKVSIVTTAGAGNVSIGDSLSVAGVVDATTGFRQNSTAGSGHVLRGNGTNFVDAALAAADLSNGVTGSGAVVLATSPTLVTPVLGVASATSLAVPLISTSSTQLKLSETGDALGILNMYLRNRGGSNGAIFENPSVCLTDFGMQTSAIITNIAIDGSNNLTVTAVFASVASSLPSVGQKVTLSGLTTATFLNAQVVTIATISATQFTASFTHALYASAVDTGIAVAQNNVRAEFRNDKISSLNPSGEIQFFDPTNPGSGAWLSSGVGLTAITGVLSVGASPSTGFALNIGGDGSVKSLGASSQYESNDGTVRGITGVQAFTSGSYNIGTTTAHPNLFFVGATSILGLHKTATLPTQTNQPLVIAGGFSSPVAAKIYVGDGTGWELDFAKRTASTDTTLFKMKDSGVLDIATGITIAGAATTGNVLRGNGTNFVSAALIAADIPSLAASKITSGTLALAQGGTGADLSGTGATSFVLTQFGLGAPITVRQLASSNLSDGTTGSGTIVLNSSPTLASMLMTGLITKYNNITTVGNGVASEVATVNLTTQAAAIATTTLYAVPASGAGQYRISWDAKITRAATTSNTLGPLTISYTDPDGVVITTTMPGVGANPTTGIGESVSTLSTSAVLFGFTLTLNCKASTNITYAFAYASVGTTSMQYNLHIRLENLG